MATLEERLAARAQQRGTQAPAGGAPDTTLSLEERLARRGAAKAVATTATTPTTTQPTNQDPGFWGGLWSQVNPIEAIKGIGKASEALGKQKEELKKAQGGKWSMLDEAAWEAKTVGQLGWGAAKGLIVDMPAEIYWDAKHGRYRTAAGKAVGNVAMLGGAGLAKRLVKGAAQVPKAAAVLSKAEQELANLRGKLPGGAGTQARAAAAGKTGQAQAYTQFEGARQAGRQAAQKQYTVYNKYLNHPSNVKAPGTLTLRPAEFKLVKGFPVEKTSAIKNTVDWVAPVKTSTFRKELDQLIELDRMSPFPVGSPVRKVLDAFGVEKADELSAAVTGAKPLSKGFDYIQFDDLKQALGKLSVFARTEGAPATAAQKLARDILDKAKPVMLDEMKRIAATARGSKQKPEAAFRAMKKAMERGDEAWAKYIAGFARQGQPTSMKAARQAYTLQEATRPATTKGIPPTKGIKTVEEAIGLVEPAGEAARRAGKVRKSATELANEDWVKHITSNPTNLDTLTSVAGPQVLPEVLGMVLDNIKTTRDWSQWEKINPAIVQRLTAHSPGLSDSITGVFKQLATAEQTAGKQATESALRRAVTTVQEAHKTRAGRFLMPKTVTTIADLVSLFLRDPSAASMLNQTLMQQLPKVPAGVRVTKAAATGAQVSVPVRRAAEAVPPPSQRQDQMAGD